MGKLYFLRHGESESNVRDTFSGMKDDALLLTAGFDPAAIETDARLAEYDMGALTGQPRTSVASAQLIAAEGLRTLVGLCRGWARLLLIWKARQAPSW